MRRGNSSGWELGWALRPESFSNDRSLVEGPWNGPNRWFLRRDRHVNTGRPARMGLVKLPVLARICSPLFLRPFCSSLIVSVRCAADKPPDNVVAILFLE